MSTHFPPRLQRELRTIRAMVELYCHQKHTISEGSICQECSELLKYAEARLNHCPYQAMKPTCGKCPVHCYKKNMQAKVREIMRYSGPKMIWHHPVMAIWHLMDGAKKTKSPLLNSRINNDISKQ